MEINQFNPPSPNDNSTISFEENPSTYKKKAKQKKEEDPQFRTVEWFAILMLFVFFI